MASVTFKAGDCYSLIPEVTIAIDNFIWNICVCLFMKWLLLIGDMFKNKKIKL